MTLAVFLKSKAAFIISLIFLILLLGSFFQKNSQQAKIDLEKADLEKQAYSIEQRNEELLKSLEYLTSESSKEKIARSQLNLKKQGETVYSFAEAKNNTTDAAVNPFEESSNFKKWLYYFSNTN